MSKLNSTYSVNGTLASVDDYHYYWFVNTYKENKKWEHFLALSVEGVTQDADLFVSFGDGRKPTYDDNDWASTSLGPDFIALNYSSNVFVGRGYPS